jgi:hypothetical protein
MGPDSLAKDVWIQILKDIGDKDLKSSAYAALM